MGRGFHHIHQGTQIIFHFVRDKLTVRYQLVYSFFYLACFNQINIILLAYIPLCNLFLHQIVLILNLLWQLIFSFLKEGKIACRVGLILFDHFFLALHNIQIIIVIEQDITHTHFNVTEIRKSLCHIILTHRIVVMLALPRCVYHV